MKGFGRDLSQFQALDAEIFGISYDTPETQHRFAVHCAADFPFLSDSGGKVAKQFEAAGGFGPIKFAKRRTIVIDRQGIIRFIYDGMPDNRRILADLKNLPDS
jgi:peroxiredoxin Q/BCP